MWKWGKKRRRKNGPAHLRRSILMAHRLSHVDGLPWSSVDKAEDGVDPQSFGLAWLGFFFHGDDVLTRGWYRDVI